MIENLEANECFKVGVFVDKKTGVHYILCRGYDGGVAITPRLKKDGSICTDYNQNTYTMGNVSNGGSVYCGNFGDH